jgi:ribosomal-protein-alanine N-acetyltransferase
MISFVEITPDNFYGFRSDILDIERLSFVSPWSPASFEEEIVRPVSCLWGIKRDSRLRGYICFWVLADEVQLMNIAVHPSSRGRGLGRLLINRMLGIAAREGIGVIWLEVRPSNHAARALYQETGFEEIARRPRYYSESNEDGIVMALSLLNAERERKMPLKEAVKGMPLAAFDGRREGPVDIGDGEGLCGAFLSRVISKSAGR